MLEHDDTGGQHLRIALKKLQDMAEYCETTGCRRKFLLTYFGEEYLRENCGACDTCDHPPDMIDCTDAAKTIAACVKQLPHSFGIELISDVLRGSKGAKVHEYGLAALSAYGSGKKYSKAQYRIWINELIRQGFLVRAGDKYPVIQCTPRTDELLRGRCKVMLPVPEAGQAMSGTSSVVSLDAGAEDLFRRLKALRKEIADANGVPPYVIFPDRTLRELAAARPSDMTGFSAVFGVGEFKREKYGQVFLAEICRQE